jgi:hypothetical protein
VLPRNRSSWRSRSRHGPDASGITDRVRIGSAERHEFAECRAVDQPDGEPVANHYTLCAALFQRPPDRHAAAHANREPDANTDPDDDTLRAAVFQRPPDRHAIAIADRQSHTYADPNDDTVRATLF